MDLQVDAESEATKYMASGVDETSSRDHRRLNREKDGANCKEEQIERAEGHATVNPACSNGDFVTKHA